jgi:hypothetical protein
VRRDRWGQERSPGRRATGRRPPTGGYHAPRRRCEVDEQRALPEAGRGDDSMQVEARTILWISWARIAVQHEAMARAVAQAIQRPGADQSHLLEQEAEAGMISVCGAAFALEALSRELSELGAIPQATLDRWREKRKKGQGPAAENVTCEVLAQTIDARGLVTTWRGELGWLFDLRDSSVHYEGALAPLESHPLGVNVAPSQVAYSAENATRAVDLLLKILERCRDKPKPPARDWSYGMHGAVDELADRRRRAA